MPEPPPPGSTAALDRGCTCPVVDNGHGRRPDGCWVVVVGCPVHCPEAITGEQVTAP